MNYNDLNRSIEGDKFNPSDIIDDAEDANEAFNNEAVQQFQKELVIVQEKNVTTERKHKVVRRGRQ